ncbi:hypothetical protein [Parachlamydia sp. AcF125]|uniref:hypothetical protein n=1 Tax=Parachlamydia sp. AcF125 TaxID=2795736 RepID=UPI001BC9DF4D|nr:hypothetical protein [Parachlamydia sp. AcF125]MBS4169158.1 hypothetical protein [Parachlamydia sp. AcF125]
MPGNLDSLGKCEPPSHLYSPYVSSAKMPRVPKDTIESSAQQEVQKQVDEQFKSENKPLLVLVLVSTSKLFFSVIIFPPYFFLYEIPKWLAKELTPRMVEIFLANWNKGGELLLQLATLMRVKFIFPLQLLSRKYTQVLEYIRHRLQKVKKNGERIIKQGLEPFLRMLGKSYARVKSINQTFLGFFSSQQQKLKSKLTDVSSFLKLPKAAAKKMGAILYSPSLHSFFKSIKIWAAGKGKEAFKILKRENANTKAKAEKIVQKWKEAIRPYTEAATKKIHSTQIQLTYLYQQFTNQLAEWTKPMLIASWLKAKGFGYNLKVKAVEGLARFIDASKAGFQWVKMPLSPAYQIGSQMAHTFLKFLPPALGSRLSRGKELGRQLINHSYKALRLLVIKSLSLKQRVITALQKMYQFMKSFKEKGRQAFQKAKKQVLALMKQGVVIAMKMGEKSAIWLIRVILWIRIIMAWIRVLSMYGLQLLPQLSEQVLIKLRLRSN